MRLTPRLPWTIAVVVLLVTGACDDGVVMGENRRQAASGPITSSATASA